MKYATVVGSIATGSSETDAFDLAEHPMVSVYAATFAAATATVGMRLLVCDTIDGTFVPLYRSDSNLVVPWVATAFAGGGTVHVGDVGMRYIKVGLVANTATAASEVRVYMRSQ